MVRPMCTDLWSDQSSRSLQDRRKCLAEDQAGDGTVKSLAIMGFLAAEILARKNASICSNL